MHTLGAPHPLCHLNFAVLVASALANTMSGKDESEQEGAATPEEEDVDVDKIEKIIRACREEWNIGVSRSEATRVLKENENDVFNAIYTIWGNAYPRPPWTPLHRANANASIDNDKPEDSDSQ